MHDHDELERVRELLPARHRARWSLFTDWCIGVGVTPMPADRETLIEFVRANPAAVSTQRERLAAVRAAHMHAQVPVPAKADVGAVRGGGGREWLSSEAAQVVAALPSAGWPSGLFGRRDALLLVLSKAAGLSYGQIERLQRSQVRVVNSTLQVQVGQVWVEVTATDDPRSCPAAVFLRWARLLAYVDRWPATAALAAALAKAEPITAASRESYAPLPQVIQDGPLLVPIDRWGGLGMGRWRHKARARWGLSATAIGEIVAAHLAGNGGRHVGSGWDGLPRVVEPEVPDSPLVSPLSDVDPSVGWQARARAQAQLADVRDTLNDVEREAEALAAKIAAILGDDNA
ncbi:hypothetical protein [Rhodococcus qingshengii]|uniref:Recombinase n=1 Tax=Rhodococcus qingshengii TaxID=334542 RepID=A0A2A5J3I1_RHOSG|nr:hypothetical protein [Rhodococcus qingshengii]PCK24148.1 hypothetical protein CHR55_27290 [Rhodococcus qingshengii]